MIDSPSQSIRLTFEQTQQLAEMEGRLSLIQSEIGNSQKILKGVRMEIDRAVKEKSYQEELSNNLKLEIENLEAKHKELTQEVDKSNSTVTENNQKIKELQDSHYEKANKLMEEVKKFEIEKEEFNKKVEDFNIKSNQLLEDQLSIKTAKDAFQKAIEAVTW